MFTSANSSARSRRGPMGSSKLPLSRLEGDPGVNPASLLGFQFRDPSLFRCALVHRSYCNEHGLDASDSYERLEFLGDAVLELIISAHLYRQFADADEGQLTKARSALVRGEMLARVARRLGLGQHLLVGRGVEASGGRDQDSVLAAALEAVIAAVYLDKGLEAARDFVRRHMAPELAEIARNGTGGRLKPEENPKSRLQELLQGQGRPTPAYRLAGREGPDHNPVFNVEAVVGSDVIGVGRGGKKSEAERAAAEQALASLLSTSAPYSEGVGTDAWDASELEQCHPDNGAPPETKVESGNQSGQTPASAPRLLGRLRLKRKH